MAATLQQVATPLPRATPPREQRAMRAWTVGVFLAANGVVTLGLWLRHGGMDTLQGPGGLLTGVGQLTGLGGTYAVLVEVLLMSRIGWLEQAIGFDRLAVWHRWGGFASVVLLSIHAVSITLGYAASGGQSVPIQLGDFVRHYPDVLMSIVGLALFFGVAITSMRALRRRLSREAWYTMHLYVYVAIALSFAHQLSVGTDFSRDAVARAWWVALYAATAAAILAWRVGRPLWFNARHQLRIHSVTPEADGIVSVYLTGRRLDALRAEAGQFFLWRFLTGNGWAKAHPFSLSAAPNARYVRITVKDLGDHTRRMQLLQPGTRVFAEGPYGTFTAERRTRRRVALIAGGIGITPLRALLETLHGDPGDVTLLYRVAAHTDIAFRQELTMFADRQHIDIRLLVDPVIGDDQSDGLGIPALRRQLPDIAQRDVYVCGPAAMLAAVRRRLAALNVPPQQVHYEQFEY